MSPLASHSSFSQLSPPPPTTTSAGPKPILSTVQTLFFHSPCSTAHTHAQCPARRASSCIVPVQSRRLHHVRPVDLTPETTITFISLTGRVFLTAAADLVVHDLIDLVVRVFITRQIQTVCTCRGCNIWKHSSGTD